MLTPFGPITFTFADLADIVATSVLVYYLLLLIRDTRAAQIVTGLVVLAVVFALANAGHLLVLATVMQYLLLGTAVTLPIVFQPELRRALEQIGRGRFFRAETEVRAGSSEAIAVLAAHGIRRERYAPECAALGRLAHRDLHAALAAP